MIKYYQNPLYCYLVTSQRHNLNTVAVLMQFSLLVSVLLGPQVSMLAAEGCLIVGNTECIAVQTASDGARRC